jgi:hypothetical protein
MKRIVITLLTIGTAFSTALSQEKSEIITDRPDQTEAPALVPTGGLQIETGFIYEKDAEKKVNTTSFTYNTTLLKYGVNENFELRFISEYLGERTVNETEVSTVKGFSPLAIGLKIRLADEKGFWPQTALIGHVNLKTGSSEFEPHYTAADFRFTMAHTLSDKFSLSYNIGAEWDGESPETRFLYTLSIGYVVSKRIGLFVEGYSFFPEESKADNRIDGGVTVKFTPIVQWDISGGVGLSSNAPDSFVSTGLSVRMFK